MEEAHEDALQKLQANLDQMTERASELESKLTHVTSDEYTA